MSPKSHTAAIERALNLVDGSTYSVEVIYFEDQAEAETVTLPRNIDAQAPTPTGETAIIPSIDLIDFTEPDLTEIAAEALYVWAGDAEPHDSPLDQGPINISQHSSLQTDAQAWELAA